jgi:predicted patatin/cPLA2 family phospholipase
MTAQHPVAEILQARRKASRPGRAWADGLRVGLAVEGGGMRGVISGAMLTALKDLGYDSCFDAVYAISAGAINSAYFLAGSGWQTLAVYYDDLIGGEFFDLRRVMRRQPVLSLDYVLDVVMEKKHPLDYAAVLSSPIELHITASSLGTLAPRTFSDFDSKEQLKTILKASACLPLIAGPPVDFDGDLFLDGGVLLAHPILTALDDKCTHVLVIRTRAAGTASVSSSVQQRVLAVRLQSIRPGLGPALLATIRQYSEVRKYIQQASHSAEGPPFILEVACPPGSHDVRRLSQDKGLIFEGIRAGYSAMLAAMEGRDITTYLRPAVPE